MKKWSKYPVTIRASMIGAIITVLGAILITIMTRRDFSPIEIAAIKSIKEYLNQDSILISEKVKAYYKFNAIKVKKLDRLDLDKNGVTNEFIIIYQPIDEQYTYYYDVFTIRDSTIHNLYHDKFFCDCIDYDIIKGENHNYLLKTWKDGSGGYLSLEIYRYTDHTRLTKIYATPDTLDTFQGHYIRIDDIMYLILSNKRYTLKIDSNDQVNLVPFTKRLSSSDMQNSEHVLRFDEEDHHLIITFDNNRLLFEKSNNNGDTLTSKDIVLLGLNDICWLDDNSIIPAGLRYFDDPHFEQNFSLFDNLIAKKSGIFTYDFINEGYGDVYRINFKIQDEFKNFN
jgi:hypothetical protein